MLFLSENENKVWWKLSEKSVVKSVPLVDQGEYAFLGIWSIPYWELQCVHSPGFQYINEYGVVNIHNNVNIQDL